MMEGSVVIAQHGVGAAHAQAEFVIGGIADLGALEVDTDAVRKRIGFEVSYDWSYSISRRLTLITLAILIGNYL